MAGRGKQESMRVKLSGEARLRVTDATRKFFVDELDYDLSEFQAERVVEFFVAKLGAPVYNQAVSDVRTYMQMKLDDIDGEFYEPE
ncbi:MAG: hypothetical protein ACI9QQ_002912 [Myxococcota bacterium]